MNNSTIMFILLKKSYFHVRKIAKMKAIIPVAGAGTKLRPHTYTQPKALIPLAGRTILNIIVDQLKDAGINEFIFIIGYLGEKIQDYVTHHYPDLNCHFVTQNNRFGTGHAVELTRNIVGDDDVTSLSYHHVMMRRQEGAPRACVVVVVCGGVWWCVVVV